MFNRCKKAREQAGLSLQQAARVTGIAVETLHTFEDPKDPGPPEEMAQVIASYYGCSVEWLLGNGPDRDYATVKAMKGSEQLSDHDRDVLAEFAASLPRRKQPTEIRDGGDEDDWNQFREIDRLRFQRFDKFEDADSIHKITGKKR